MVKSEEHQAVEDLMVQALGAMARYNARHALGMGMEINDSIRYGAMVKADGEIVADSPTQAMENAAISLQEFKRLQREMPDPDLSQDDVNRLVECIRTGKKVPKR